MIKVMKFGGTSVGTADRIKHVAQLVNKEPGQRFLVLSAMSGTTNSLVEIADYFYKGNDAGALETIYQLERKYRQTTSELFQDPDTRQEAVWALRDIFDELRNYTSHDFSSRQEKEILSRGELMSTTLMELYMRQRRIAAIHLSALDFMRLTPEGEPDSIYISRRLRELLAELPTQPQIIITEGFICRDHDGAIDNLRRGGSDYTASLIGAALRADEVQIWTDIDGMHNNDPRYVEGTKPVSELSFEEAAELAYFGAKILHPTCVLPAKLYNIPVRLLNTLQPEAPGTLIHNSAPLEGGIQAIAAKDGITAIKITSGRMMLNYGFMHKVFETFERHRTAIDLMATSEVSVTLTIDNDEKLHEITEQLKHFGTVSVDRDMVIICIVGDLRWQNRGLEAKVMQALADIPIRLISYGGSDYNISVLVRAGDKIEALRALSAALFQ